MAKSNRGKDRKQGKVKCDFKAFEQAVKVERMAEGVPLRKSISI